MYTEDDIGAMVVKVKRLCEGVPKMMVFSGMLGGGGASESKTGMVVDPREARLARFAVAPAAVPAGGPSYVPAGGPSSVPAGGPSSAPAAAAEPLPAPPLPSPSTTTTTSTTNNTDSKTWGAPSVFKSDPCPKDSYEIKFGLKSLSSLESEQKARNLAEAHVRAKRMKVEKEDARSERERLRRQLELDKIERRENGGKLNGKLSVNGYSPATIEKNYDGWQKVSERGSDPTATAAKKEVAVDDRNVGEIVDECIGQVSQYRSGGAGGETLSLLLLFVTNIVENVGGAAGGDWRKFRRISTQSKGYRGKVKGRIGAGRLLKVVGFRGGGGGGGGGGGALVMETVDLELLRETKKKLERAKFAFEAAGARAKEVQLSKLSGNEPGGRVL